MENLKKKNKKDKGGQPKKHGGFSFLAKVKLPQDRKRITKYLSSARENLIADLGPTEDDLTAAQIILIDRVIMKLGVLRCVEEHIKDTSVIKGDDLAPTLRASYLAYDNSIRLCLRELGINTKKSDEVLSVQEYIKEFDKEQAEKAKVQRKADTGSPESDSNVRPGSDKGDSIDKASPDESGTPGEKS